MIELLLELLQRTNKDTIEIQIAKGKNKLPTSIKELWRKKK